jgi:hypothetical protein
LDENDPQFKNRRIIYRFVYKGSKKIHDKELLMRELSPDFEEVKDTE